jgi:hypothetical protein
MTSPLTSSSVIQEWWLLWLEIADFTAVATREIRMAQNYMATPQVWNNGLAIPCALFSRELRNMCLDATQHAHTQGVLCLL